MRVSAEKSGELERERPYLLGIAYRMLGSASDAEDVVQEALLRAADHGDLRSLRAFLTTVVTRLCLDELRSARRRREQYVGPWLPEPVLTRELDAPPAAHVEHKENVSLALLVLLERLTPSERVVFVLRELLDLDFAEVAEATDRSEAACRQLLSRARRHLGRNDGAPAPSNAQMHVANALLIALSRGDLNDVMKVLADGVVATTDHGGKASAARRPVQGRQAVARFLLGLLEKAQRSSPAFTTTPALLNGAPAVVLHRADGAIETAVVLRIETTSSGPCVAAISLFRNPDKLTAITNACTLPTRLAR